MKFNLIFIIFFLFSCSNGTFNTNNNKSYTSKGFALIYDENDYQNKIISTKLNPIAPPANEVLLNKIFEAKFIRWLEKFKKSDRDRVIGFIYLFNLIYLNQCSYP